MTVTILLLDTAHFGKQIQAGKFRWDAASGRGVTIDPSDHNNAPLLQRLYDSPLHDHHTGDPLSPKTHPKEWLEALQYQYRSPYLTATEPQS